MSKAAMYKGHRITAFEESKIVRHTMGCDTYTAYNVCIDGVDVTAQINPNATNLDALIADAKELIDCYSSETIHTDNV